jgi:hydrogenase-1 operon protein HyaF
VKESNACQEYPLTQNVVPILHEIRHALHKLLEDGVSTIIDLRAMPFAPGEEVELEQRLGVGEVVSQVSALGPSEVKEMGIPGVWLVTHFNTEDEIMSKFIEVTFVPSIIKSQPDDIERGIQDLEADLDTDS